MESMPGSAIATQRQIACKIERNGGNTIRREIDGYMNAVVARIHIIRLDMERGRRVQLIHVGLTQILWSAHLEPALLRVRMRIVDPLDRRHLYRRLAGNVHDR